VGLARHDSSRPPHPLPPNPVAIIASGAWDPRPSPEEPTEIDEWDEALRRGGTRALVDLFKLEDTGVMRREALAIPTARAFLDHWFARRVW
jgi:hypothetical protein